MYSTLFPAQWKRLFGSFWARVEIEGPAYFGPTGIFPKGRPIPTVVPVETLHVLFQKVKEST